MLLVVLLSANQEY